jgi:pilus assembly protein CpaF
MVEGRSLVIEQKQRYDSIPYLIELMKEQFYNILRSDTSRWKLSKSEVLKWEKSKQSLRQAIKNCSYGDEQARCLIQEYMKEFLENQLDRKEELLNQILPFEKPLRMKERTKFLILLYLTEKEHGKDALSFLIQTYRWNQPKYDGEDAIYEVNAQDLDRIFYLKYRKLNYVEKLELVIQTIYESSFGYGIADRILTMNLDGVSAGVSKDVLSLWIFYKGTMIHFSCLKFEEEQELIRICKNIYRYGNYGQLSQTRGYITGNRKDGSRVVVMRPPFSESWVFFVRKFDIAKQLELADILVRDQTKCLRTILKWIVKGCQVTGITGDQGCGKTTLLMALIGLIPHSYTIRTQELTFELQLRERYPERNIVSLRETEQIHGQEALDILKKTDGVVTILGEVATNEVSSWLIQVSQTASLFTMFTHHAKTTKDLIEGLRNALLQAGGFRNEEIALKQVMTSIRFDIHMAKTRNGERFVERVTEIVPIEEGVDTRDIILWENGRYCKKHAITKETQKQILKYLTVQERKQFLIDMEQFLEKESLC